MFIDSPYAYHDTALKTKHGQTISQPTVVADLLVSLYLHKGLHCLDIGCGTGYTTALIACCIGNEGSVIGIDIYEDLVNTARDNTASYPNITIYKGSKENLGWEKKGPYRRILLNAATKTGHIDLIPQLGPDGFIVLPEGTAEACRIAIYKRTTTGLEEQEPVVNGTYSFVPLQT